MQKPIGGRVPIGAETSAMQFSIYRGGIDCTEQKRISMLLLATVNYNSKNSYRINEGTAQW